MIENTQSTVSTMPPYYGKYRGQVIDNNDPMQMGRIRAQVPEVLGDVLSAWALPCVPYAGAGSGQYTLPEVGTHVWIEFEAGDPSRPIWTGCWWAPGESPSGHDRRESTPAIRLLRSEQGLLLSLDDERQVLTIGDGQGLNLLQIHLRAGTVTLQGATKVVVQAPQVELAGNATHPLALGDALLTYLSQVVSLYNSHVHPGQVPGPPVPPMPPAPPAILSSQVSSG